MQNFVECRQRLEKITEKNVSNYGAQAWEGLWVLETHSSKTIVMLFLQQEYDF